VKMEQFERHIRRRLERFIQVLVSRVRTPEAAAAPRDAAAQ